MGEALKSLAVDRPGFRLISDPSTHRWAANKGSGFTGVQTSAHVIQLSLNIQVKALPVFLKSRRKSVSWVRTLCLFILMCWLQNNVINRLKKDEVQVIYEFSLMAYSLCFLLLMSLFVLLRQSVSMLTHANCSFTPLMFCPYEQLSQIHHWYYGKGKRIWKKFSHEQTSPLNVITC